MESSGLTIAFRNHLEGIHGGGGDHSEWLREPVLQGRARASPREEETTLSKEQKVFGGIRGAQGGSSVDRILYLKSV